MSVCMSIHSCTHIFIPCRHTAQATKSVVVNSNKQGFAMAGKGYRKIRKSLRLIHVCPCLLNLAYKQSLPFLHLQLQANWVRQGKLDDMGGYITNEPEDSAKTIEVAIEASSDDSQRQVRTIRPPTRTAS